jgi:hypothetical protein
MSLDGLSLGRMTPASNKDRRVLVDDIRDGKFRKSGPTWRISTRPTTSGSLVIGAIDVAHPPIYQGERLQPVAGGASRLAKQFENGSTVTRPTVTP